jgi:hypothetical protein
MLVKSLAYDKEPLSLRPDITTARLSYFNSEMSILPTPHRLFNVKFWSQSDES